MEPPTHIMGFQPSDNADTLSSATSTCNGHLHNVCIMYIPLRKLADDTEVVQFRKEDVSPCLGGPEATPAVQQKNGAAMRPANVVCCHI